MTETLWTTNIDEINNIFIGDMCNRDVECINDGIISTGLLSYNTKIE